MARQVYWNVKQDKTFVKLKAAVRDLSHFIDFIHIQTLYKCIVNLLFAFDENGGYTTKY